MNRTNLEWARLGPADLLIATERSAWLTSPEDAPRVALLGVMMGPGSLETTRKLLDGAVGAAFPAAARGPVPELTPTRWAFRLAGLYHLTHSTPSLMRAASRRFAAQGREALASWADRKAREEHNHDVLALRDLEALGYRAEATVHAVVPAIAERLLRFFQDSAGAADPIACVGYSYTLERLAMTVDEDEIRRVEAVLPPGVRATRCLRVHSGIGSDADHVADTVAVVAELSGPERTQIAVACHRAARLCFETPREGHPTDAQIERALRGLERPLAASA